MCSAKIIPFNSYALEYLDFDFLDKVEIPFYSYFISAGFPSPADDYLEDKIDLGKYLIQNPTSTFMMRVKGDSMVDANIHEGDILVIDKSLKASDGMPVVCFLDGEFTVKTFKRINDRAFLMPANPVYKPIQLTEGMNMQIWGVVVWILHKPVKL
jgi:DNA polymerase V